MAAFDSKENEARFAASVDHAQIAASDYSLSVSSYVEAKDNREVVDITQLNAELKTTVAKIDKFRTEIDAIVAEIEGEEVEALQGEIGYMEKLLDGVAVEWLQLGEIGEFIRGNGLQKNIDDGFPAIHYGQIYTRYGLSADKTYAFVSEELANRLKKAQRNDLSCSQQHRKTMRM